MFLLFSWDFSEIAQMPTAEQRISLIAKKFVLPRMCVITGTTGAGTLKNGNICRLHVKNVITTMQRSVGISVPWKKLDAWGLLAKSWFQALENSNQSSVSNVIGKVELHLNISGKRMPATNISKTFLRFRLKNNFSQHHFSPEGLRRRYNSKTEWFSGRNLHSLQQAPPKSRP